MENKIAMFGIHSDPLAPLGSQKTNRHKHLLFHILYHRAKLKEILFLNKFTN
jgi:hypothetical protein